MNAAFSPDVDPHRRRIHDQYLRIRRQPPRNHDLLLITSGESLNRKVGIRDLYPKSLDPGTNDLTPFEVTDKAKLVQETIHGSQNEVRPDRLTNDQSLPDSVFRNVTDSQSNRLLSGRNFHRSPLEIDFPGIGSIHPEQSKCKLSSPGTEQSGQTENLTPVKLKCDSPEVVSLRQVPRLQKDFPLFSARSEWVGRDFLARHQSNQLWGVEFAPLEGANPFSVPENRESFSHL